MASTTKKAGRTSAALVTESVKLQAPPLAYARKARIALGPRPTVAIMTQARVADDSLDGFWEAVRLCVSDVEEDAVDGTVWVDCNWGPCHCMPGLYESLEALLTGEGPVDSFLAKTTQKLQAVWTKAKADVQKKWGPGYELTVFVCNGPPALAVRRVPKRKGAPAKPTTIGKVAGLVGKVVP